MFFNLQALDGPRHYQIADHGGLIVAVPADSQTPNLIKFSLDMGRCWHSYKFTDQNVVMTGLLTEPGNKAMSIGIWGFGAEDRVWNTFVLNFTTIVPNKCGKSTLCCCHPKV